MTDDELKALWMYLHSLPAGEQGGSKLVARNGCNFDK